MTINWMLLHVTNIKLIHFWVNNTNRDLISIFSSRNAVDATASVERQRYDIVVMDHLAEGGHIQFWKLSAVIPCMP